MVTRVMEEGYTTEDADDPAFQENTAEEGPSNDNDDEPSLEELLESVEKLSIDSKNFLDTEGLIEDIEDAPLLTEFEEPEMEEQTFSEDVYAEVQPRKWENPDDLDSTFKEIVAGDLKQQSVASSNIKESEMSFLGGIIPEPEEPLERVVPGAFSESERRHHLAERLIKTRMLLLVHLHLSRLIIKVPIYKKGNMKIVAAVWIRSPESRSNIFLKSYWILLCKTK